MLSVCLSVGQSVGRLVGQSVGQSVVSRHQLVGKQSVRRKERMYSRQVVLARRREAEGSIYTGKCQGTKQQSILPHYNRISLLDICVKRAKSYSSSMARLFTPQSKNITKRAGFNIKDCPVEYRESSFIIGLSVYLLSGQSRYGRYRGPSVRQILFLLSANLYKTISRRKNCCKLTSSTYPQYSNSLLFSQEIALVIISSAYYYRLY